MSETITLKDHAILVLPFTPFLLHSPAPLLAIISNTLTSGATKSFTIVFTTPPLPSTSTSRFSNSEPEPSSSSSSSSSQAITAELQDHVQLYSHIRSSPQEYFTQFQLFLGKVYAALASAQWRAERVVMDTEVHFDGESGDWEEKLFRGEKGDDYQVIMLEGVESSLSANIASLLSSLPNPTLPSPSLPPVQPYQPPPPRPPHPIVALGGTFDHLHAAHKLLLHLAYVLTGEKLIVGLMADRLLGSKTHAELVQSLEERLEGVQRFLSRLGGRVKATQGFDDDDTNATPAGETLDTDTRPFIAAGEIQDALGPTGYDPNIQALVVSRETYSGGIYVNKIRKEKNLEELELYVVDVIADKEGLELGEEREEGKLKELKMGSTGIRTWLKEKENGKE
ncbi:hypothetical protein CI109_100293 [Kwoniella shandongensis]|uniref:Uncharacterized protein n=1 Tax=Kwoniella shandongensis TaxID=1734106 RepID=A0A5M6C808_9TREE|nr:uncharacterized protein CI109_001862 [Kwoniella shandongensis]KAA5529922.1 hypothetical protein CI109_001862 [Kwoniella shandongensis]